jgi:hypothetical protein
VEKVCIPLWRTADEPAATAVALLPQLTTAPGLRGATLHVEAPGYDALRHGGGHRLLTGLLSLWVDSYQDLDLTALRVHPPAGDAYLVTESVPTPYGGAFTWSEGERSPGLSMVTLLDKPAATSEADFYRAWHGLHRLTTAECHPFTCYVRNEIVRPLSDGAPVYRGIVTESAPDEQDFLDPHRFYVSGGDADRLRANQKRVVEEIVQFIDLATMQVAPMHEYVVRRLAPTSP